MAQQEIRYNMAELFASAFGAGHIPVFYKSIKEENEHLAEADYRITDDKDQQAGLYYNGLNVVTTEVLKGNSWMGTPVNFTFGFKGGNYQYYEGGQLKVKEMDDFQMPLTTMVDLSRAKRDTITPTAGGNGSVKELYSFDDWKIKIRGICIFDPEHPHAKEAREQRNKIAAFENLVSGIDLLEDDGLFTDLGIYRLYIHSVNFPQLPGKPNMLPFELECVSDEPVELIL